MVKDIEVEYLRSERISLTLSNTKRGTDLGTLVVPFDQTFHPLHLSRFSDAIWNKTSNDIIAGNGRERFMIEFRFIDKCFFEGYSLDRIKMTKWIWRKVELDRKIDNNEC